MNLFTDHECTGTPTSMPTSRPTGRPNAMSPAPTHLSAPTNEVDDDAYTGLTPITNREYEENEQDRKRQIRLVDPSFVEQFVDEFKVLMEESVI